MKKSGKRPQTERQEVIEHGRTPPPERTATRRFSSLVGRCVKELRDETVRLQVCLTLSYGALRVRQSAVFSSLLNPPFPLQRRDKLAVTQTTGQFTQVHGIVVTHTNRVEIRQKKKKKR